MAKDPAFLFYPGDWLGGTLGMTLEEKGAYMEVLMLQFNRGHMDGHMIGQVVGQTWEKIKHKFEIDGDGKYYNARLEVEVIKRKEFTNSRKNNLKGKNQYSKDSGHMGGHKTTLMENENEDINKLNVRESFFKDLENSSHIETISRDNKAPVLIVKKHIELFRPNANVEYRNFVEFVNHFKNWFKKQYKPLTNNRNQYT